LIADLPPAAVVQCTEAVDLARESNGATFFFVARKASAIERFLAVASKYAASWSIAAQAELKGIKSVTLRGALKILYREIGELIFEAQRIHLLVSFSTYPAIWEVENNALQN
jgi:hypothetical protein